MAKSKIIKELAKSQVDLESIMKQLKILLLDLGKDDYIEWINHELQGYPTNEDLPEYRRCGGVLKGSFLNGWTQCTEISIPLVDDTPDEVRRFTSKVYFTEGISALKQLQSGSGMITVSMPGDVLPYIQKYSAVSMTCLFSAKVEVSEIAVTRILSIIENKVMDILLLLEKEFGCLDDLDLNISGTSDMDIEKVKSDISLIIYDKHIELGNNNTIKNSDIIT